MKNTKLKKQPIPKGIKGIKVLELPAENHVLSVYTPLTLYERLEACSKTQNL